MSGIVFCYREQRKTTKLSHNFATILNKSWEFQISRPVTEIGPYVFTRPTYFLSPADVSLLYVRGGDGILRKGVGPSCGRHVYDASEHSL